MYPRTSGGAASAAILILIASVLMIPVFVVLIPVVLVLVILVLIVLVLIVLVLIVLVLVVLVLVVLVLIILIVAALIVLHLHILLFVILGLQKQYAAKAANYTLLFAGNRSLIASDSSDRRVENRIAAVMETANCKIQNHP